MWDLRMVAFLAVVIAAEPSLYGHHIHQPPAVSFYNPHQSNTGPSEYYHQNPPQEINVQQPQISIQPQISLQQQIDPNSVNITAGHQGAYWPQHIGHHPGFGWPNGGISYRTEPPNPNEVHPSSLLFGTQGWGNPVFIQPATNPTPKPASRNNDNNENNRPKTKANNFKTPNRNNLPKKKSQPLQKQKSRSENKTQRRKQKKTAQKKQQENEAPFNFSYIPDEFLNKGFPIYPRLELVRDAFGIPTVVPVFRLNETAVREQQKRQQQRQKNQQQQNQGQQQNINNNNQQQPLFFQNGIPVFNQGQGPVLTNINGVPVSPFVNQLNNFNNIAPFTNGRTFTNIPQQQFPNQLSNPTGFISRDATQTQQPGNGTGDPNSPFYGGWPSGGPFQPHFQGIPQHGVPYPYFGASGGGWGPQVYVNTTVVGGNAGAQPGPPARRETDVGNNNINNNNNNNNTDTTPSKTATRDNNNDDEEENENESEAEGEDQEEKSKEEVEDEEEEEKHVEEPVQEDVEEPTEEEIEENEMTKQMRLNNGNQSNALKKDPEIQISDPMGDELDEENEVDYNKSEPGDEENYVDTVEVKDEIPKDVLKQMIEEYNEKNKATPITKDEENTEQVIDKLREQVAKLLKVFGDGNPNTRSQPFNVRTLTATGIEWNRRLRDRYQLKSPIFFERPNTK